jgi:hypothetical protein
LAAVALAVPFGLEQFVLSVAEHVTDGLAGLLPTVDSQVDVQPVVISVTVTVYVPADNPLILEFVLLLLHKYVTFVEVAVAVPLPAPVQFALSVAAHVTIGLLVLLPTLLVHVAVQPVVISVTITVYTAELSPLILAAVEPLLHE